MINPATDTDLTAAAVRLFESELALSDARQTGVTEWIVAASDRLHAAAVDYAQARRAVRAPSPALYLVA